MECWNEIIDLAKDLGVLLGLGVGFIALIVNFQAIFKPNQKRSNDIKFSTMLALLEKIQNYKFMHLYETHDSLPNTITFDALSDLMSPISKQLANPFLPEKIRKSGHDFIVSILTTSNFLALGLSKRGTSCGSEAITFSNTHDVYEKHKILHKQLADYLKLNELKFNFDLKKTSKE